MNKANKSSERGNRMANQELITLKARINQAALDSQRRHAKASEKHQAAVLAEKRNPGSMNWAYMDLMFIECQIQSVLSKLID